MQEAQQRIAELTADAEENVSGVRVVKAFAQERRQRERFAHTVQRVFDQQLVATRIQAFYNPMISFLPNLGLAAILLFGGREVIDGTLSVGALHRLLRLPADADLADADARLHARRRPARRPRSGARIFEILDREPQIVSPPDAPPVPAGPGQITLARRRADVRGLDPSRR